jgi:hypothetical protein
MLRAFLIFTALTAALAAGAADVTYNTTTTVHGKQEIGSFIPGTYRFVKLGLVASSSAYPDEEQATRLGQIAMDKLVKKATLGPNQLLVNLTVERGKAYLGADEVSVVTIRADVIEIGSPEPATGTPKWGDPVAPPPAPAKKKKGGK